MKLLKACAAIAVAVALLILSAVPASATDVAFEVTSATLTTNLSAITFGPTTGVCTNFATDVDTITIDETATGSTVVTAVDMTSSYTFGTTFLVKATKHTGSNVGVIGVTSPFPTSQNLSVRLEFKTVTGAPTCVAGTTVCTVQANFNPTAGGATPLTGTASAAPVHTSGDTIGVSGTGLIGSMFLLACSAPLATLLNSNATLSLALVAP